MSDGRNKNRKRKKGYYVQAAKSKRPRLDIGMQGFLITCNKREKETVREAYNLFNEYADNIFGPEEVGEKSAENNHDSNDEDEDVEGALAKEVQALKETSNSKSRRFQVIDSGANNCVFIKTTLGRPDTLVHKIFSDLHASQKSRSRYMLRVTPVLGTCRAEEAKIEALASTVLPMYFDKDSTSSYSVMFKVRNNSTVGRKMVFSAIGSALGDLCPKVKVDLDNPDLIITVDVLRTVCCLGILKDFFKFRKYNIQEVVKVAPETTKKEQEDESTGAEPVHSNDESEDESCDHSQSQCDQDVSYALPPQDRLKVTDTNSDKQKEQNESVSNENSVALAQQ